MDAKAEDKESKATKTGNVVIDLLEFAMRFVNVDLAPFFDEHCHLWDYTDDDVQTLFNGGGESLEQHDVYRRYVTLVNQRMDDFVAQSGFDSQKDVFAAVEVAVEDDRKKRKKLMAEIQEMFANMGRALEKKDDKADDDKAPSKGGDDDDDKGTPGADTSCRPAGPAYIFSQPIGLEFLLESVLNLADYETLRMMMIMKVKERRARQEMKQKAAARRDNADRRRDDLTATRATPDILVDQYEALKQRLVDLTPYNKALRDDIAERMSRRAFDDDVDRQAHGPADHKLYEFPTDHIVKLCSMACLDIASDLEASANDLRENRGTHVAWLHLLHDTVDRICDDIDKRIIAARSRAAGHSSQDDDDAAADSKD